MLWVGDRKALTIRFIGFPISCIFDKPLKCGALEL